jgi:hypothetical protein
MSDLSRRYPVKRTAEILGCSPRAVFQLIADGTLEAFNVARRTSGP